MPPESALAASPMNHGQRTDPYLSFLRRKIKLAPETGFAIDESEVNPLLKPHQKAIVVWAIRGGRRAIFAAFGLGKSVIQLEILRILLSKVGGRALIIAPLGVRQEFARDATMLGISITFVRRSEEVDADGIYITNYESVRDGKLDVNLFVAVSLDEASVLRSFGSLTYQTFLSLFVHVRFRFVATATPSPNKFKELIHYAGFLGIMDTGQALTRFFQRDSTQANNLTLYPHKEKEFWLWLSSFAIFLQSPADLGYDATGYDLPELRVIYHEVNTTPTKTHVERDGQARLMNDASMGLSEAAAEKRDSLPERIEKMQEILAAAPSDHFILWHDLEKERHAIKAALPEAVSVYGSQDLDEREQAIIDFSDGRFQYLSTKPEIAGSGCNFQRYCHKAVFLGVGYKFNDFIQSIHRIFRFLQTHECEIHVIHTDGERQVLATLLKKWEQHKTMVAKMTEIIKEHGLDCVSMAELLTRTIGVERIEVSGDRFSVANNDAVLEARRLATDSLDQIVTSIPFANHYEYTPSYNDFGHTDNNDHFWEQMDHLTPELLRALKPGRCACIHVKNRINFGNVTGLGFPTEDCFLEETSLHFKKHGFHKILCITITTDVVRENNQTYRLGYTEMLKDGTKMGAGLSEYVLVFRKAQTDTTKGFADERVANEREDYSLARWQINADGHWRSSGDRLLTCEELLGYGPDKLAKLYTEFSMQHIYDHQFHVRLGEALEAKGALPSTFMAIKPGSHHPNVWHDVNRMLTLNTTQSQKGAALHVCPLQFDIVDRLITRFSNEGELVYDPFAGIGTVPLRALRLGRRGAGSELNTSYFFDSVHYLKACEDEMRMPSLFDMEEIETAAVPAPKEISEPKDIQSPENPIQKRPKSPKAARNVTPPAAAGEMIPERYPNDTEAICPDEPGGIRPDVSGYEILLDEVGGYDVGKARGLLAFAAKVKDIGAREHIETGGNLSLIKCATLANHILRGVASARPFPTAERWQRATCFVGEYFAVENVKGAQWLPAEMREAEA